MGNKFCPEVSNTTNDMRFVAKRVRREGQYDQHEARLSKPSPPPNPVIKSNVPGAAVKDDFTFIKVVGAGSYGKVYLV